MAWYDLIAPALGAYAAYKGADDNKTATTSNAPWSGIQPYLVGSGTVPGYLTSNPVPTQQWQNWLADASSGAEGSWLRQPPSMFDQGYGAGTYTAGQPMTGTSGGTGGSVESEIASLAAQLLSSDLGKSLLTSASDLVTPLVDKAFGITPTGVPAPVVDAMAPSATTAPYIPYGETPMLPIGASPLLETNAGIPLDAFGQDMAGWGTEWGPGATTAATVAAGGIAPGTLTGSMAEGLLGQFGTSAAAPGLAGAASMLGPLGMVGIGLMMNELFPSTEAVTYGPDGRIIGNDASRARFDPLYQQLRPYLPEGENITLTWNPDDGQWGYSSQSMANPSGGILNLLNDISAGNDQIYFMGTKNYASPEELLAGIQQNNQPRTAGDVLNRIIGGFGGGDLSGIDFAAKRAERDRLTNMQNSYEDLRAGLPVNWIRPTSQYDEPLIGGVNRG